MVIPHSYGLARYRFQDFLKISSLWSTATFDHYDVDAFNGAFNMLVDILSPYMGKAHVKSLYDIDVPRNTSTGELGKMLGYRDKLQALTRAPHLVYEFLEYGPKDNIIPIFSESQKVDELLPMEKLVEGRYRTFIIPDFVVWAAMTMMFKDMDVKLRMFPGFAVGYNKFGGGFQRLVSWLFGTWGEVPSFFREGDMKWFDRSVTLLLAIMVACVREMCYAPGNAWAEERTFYFTMLSYSCVRRLPDGRLVYKDDGINSGVPTTSSDGCLVHLFADCYSWMRANNDPRKYLQHVLLLCYSDDEIRRMRRSEEVDRFSAVLKESYKELGLTMKDWKDVPIIEGLTFLGSTFRTIDDRLVPVYEDTDKVIDSLSQPKGNYTLDQEFGRVLSLYMETYWNPTLRDLLRDYLEFLTKQGCTIPIPTHYEMRKRWFGLE